MKPFINNAVIGNSRILATLNSRGEYLRIFWPHIDYREQIEKILTGIFFPGKSSTMHWINSEEWQYTQYYVEDSNILKTIATSHLHEVRITYTDFSLVHDDIIIRNIEIENMSSQDKNVKLCLYCETVSEKSNLSSAFFDFETDSIVFFKHDNYMFVSSNSECEQFQLTNSPFDASNRLYLYGGDGYSMGHDGAMILDIGNVQPGQKKAVDLYLAFSDNLNKCRKIIKNVKPKDCRYLYKEVSTYWQDYLKKAKKVETGIKEVDNLYRRSVLVMKLMSGEGGGIIAAPEIDEDFARSGRYGYCWGRDAGFITTALDRIGLYDISRKFYEWSVKSQDGNGAWHQRYYTDGNLAPGWGIQTDETATILWGLWHHYNFTKDKEFLEENWSNVYRAAEYLLNTIDRNIGVPGLAYDLWEERNGYHAYTSAAVFGGLTAAANIAIELGKDKMLIEKYSLEALNLKESIQKNFWYEPLGRYLRSINVKLNPWGSEQNDTINIVVNKKGYIRDFSLRDESMDSSLIGLEIPFGVVDGKNIRYLMTIDKIEEILTVPKIGGIKRYENDNYIGGNPWIITTLWLAIHFIRNGRTEDGKKLFFWAVNSRTELDMLPEQVDKVTGEPAWVIPLTWSHAMFIHTLLDLIENGGL